MAMETSSHQLSRLESETLSLLVDPDGTGDRDLVAQLQGITATKREPTGVGLYVHLEVRIDAPRSVLGKAPVGNVSGKCPELADGFGAVAFVENGVLSLLEFFTFDEPWPDHITSYELRAS